MKISELNFEPHPIIPEGRGTSAKVCFDNGYGASVITGSIWYASEDAPYEVAVLKGGRVVYDTPITGGILNHQTESDVERVLGEIEAL